ncbi:MAG: hypothetical protein NC299_18175 [Lachnospiraceae bacterium]|nr:hypothetical protein [Ruminococcus sp.]MCM1277256.1 hypothetical protein [Lachnospiraceae bacterium]
MAKNILITYDEFETHINDIRRIQKFKLSLEKLCDEYNSKGKYEDCSGFDFPTLETNVVQLLKVATDDQIEWIDYWLYELDFGQTYTPGMIKISDKPVALRTIQDLWDLINDNPHYEEN